MTKAILSDEYFKEIYSDFPKWAVLLSGLRDRKGLAQINDWGCSISHFSYGKRCKTDRKNIAQRLGKYFKLDYPRPHMEKL